MQVLELSTVSDRAVVSTGFAPEGGNGKFLPQNGRTSEMQVLAQAGHSAGGVVQRQSDVNDVFMPHVGHVMNGTGKQRVPGGLFQNYSKKNRVSFISKRIYRQWRMTAALGNPVVPDV